MEGFDRYASKICTKTCTARMASKAEEYRRYAKDADKKASEVTDAQAKAIYRNIAAHWREMAEQAERSGR